MRARTRQARRMPVLRQNTDEADLRDGTRSQGQDLLTANPSCYTVVELITVKAQGEKGMYIEQVWQGKSARISSSSRCVKEGTDSLLVLGWRVKTGNPVIASVPMTTEGRLFLRVSTIRLSAGSTVISSESPVRRPSVRRTCPGRTI